MREQSVKKLIRAAMMAAVCCVATMVIQVPSPMTGYINLGDCAVLLSGWMLGPWYGLAASGLGSALADVCSGYVVYAPGTFIIKGVMAAGAALLHGTLVGKGVRRLPACLVSGLLGECVMILGYLVYDGVCLGFGLAALAGLPGSLIQGAAGLVVAVPLFSSVKGGGQPGHGEDA